MSIKIATTKKGIKKLENFSEKKYNKGQTIYSNKSLKYPTRIFSIFQVNNIIEKKCPLCGGQLVKVRRGLMCINLYCYYFEKI